MNKKRCLTYLILAGLINVGCAQLKKKDHYDIGQSNHHGRLASQKKLQQLNQWEISAKITVERKSHTFNTAYLNWKQNREDYRIHISSPFGGEHIQIEKKAGEIEIKTPNHVSKRGYNKEKIEDIIEKETGIRLPIHQIEHWIKGIPDPNLNYSIISGEKNQVKSIKQSTWLIEWKNHTLVNGVELPKKIKAIKTGVDTVKISLFISEWKI